MKGGLAAIIVDRDGGAFPSTAFPSEIGDSELLIESGERHDGFISGFVEYLHEMEEFGRCAD